MAASPPAPFSTFATPPPTNEIDALYELALVGDIVALCQRIEAFGGANPRQTEFVNTALDLARNFKLKALRKLLEPWRSTPSADA